MFTRPDDLPEAVLAGALRDGWGFTPASLEYQAVGFGSHHWLATDARGGRVFATVDDLTARLRTRQDTADAAFGRLSRALATALSLRAEAGLAFVVAPVPASGGQVVARLSGRYSLAAYPYLTGTPVGAGGEFARAGDRRAALDLLVQLHRAKAGRPRIQIDPEALALYRLWFDLAEISEYLTLFRAPHGDTADAAEAWENLRHFLRPAERWPALCNPGRAAHEPEATT